MLSNNIRIDQSYLPENNEIGSGKAGLPKGPPLGYRPLKSVSPTVSSIAKKLLSGTFGTLTPFEISNKKYLARVEPHYHPPGYKSGPTGWHKGVTVYESVDQNIKPKNQPVDRSKLYSQLDKFLKLINYP